MTTLAVTVFVLVYIGMALGRVPGLAVERTGVALLGLIVLLASGDLTLDEAGAAVDMPTIRSVVRRVEADKNRFSALVLGIVESAPFQMRVKSPAEIKKPAEVTQTATTARR